MQNLPSKVRFDKGFSEMTQKRGGKPLVVFKQCFRCQKINKKQSVKSIFKGKKTERIMETGLILINANHHKRALGHRRKGQGCRMGRGMMREGGRKGGRGFWWTGREQEEWAGEGVDVALTAQRSQSILPSQVPLVASAPVSGIAASQEI